MTRNALKSRLITIVIVLILVVVFILQNAQTVSIQLFFWEISTSRALMIFTILLAGIIVGWFGRGAWGRRRR